jgi:vacuolar-type H+-ATPase subunit I/STV1
MVKKKKEGFGEGLGISGFTLGVLSILLAGGMGIFIAVVGFLFCYAQQRKSPTRLGRIGVILNIIGFVLSILFIIWLVPVVSQQLQNLPGY